MIGMTVKLNLDDSVGLMVIDFESYIRFLFVCVIGLFYCILFVYIRRCLQLPFEYIYIYKNQTAELAVLSLSARWFFTLWRHV